MLTTTQDKPVPTTQGKSASSLAADWPRQQQAATGDRRQTQRYKMAIPALLELEGYNVASVTVFNMSMAGFACYISQYVEVGTRCWLKLPSLPGMPQSEWLSASVVRCNANVIGCSLERMLHPDEFEPFIEEYRVAA